MTQPRIIAVAASADRVGLDNGAIVPMRNAHRGMIGQEAFLTGTEGVWTTSLDALALEQRREREPSFSILDLRAERRA